MSRKVYVFHICHNKKCNNGWLDVDRTHCKTNPPKWKYCRECCKLLGIDFDKQKKPKSNRGKNLRKNNEDN